MSVKRPRIIAHRGASAVAPENTRTAFEKAIAMGADMIETDVQRTRDGHLIVIHDPVLERTTDGSGMVSEKTLAEIKNLDAGSWFDPQFRGAEILTLTELLDIVGGRCALNIEIKSLPFPFPGIEKEILAALSEAGMPLDEVVLSSFDHPVLLRAKALNPDVAVAALFDCLPADIDAFPTPILHPHWQVLTPEFVGMARRAGRTLNVWTANDVRIWHHLLQAGVDGIITNVPDQLRAFLEKSSQE